MQYNEIYKICQPVMDWLKEQYPNNHKIVISTNGAELIECGKLVVLDESLKPKPGKTLSEMMEDCTNKISPSPGTEFLKELFERDKENGE